jgi:hypothetical protein
MAVTGWRSTGRAANKNTKIAAIPPTGCGVPGVVALARMTTSRAKAAARMHQGRATRIASFSTGLAPRTRTRPAVGNSWAAMMRMSVVLPMPLRPSSPVIDGPSMSTVTSSRATWPR